MQLPPEGCMRWKAPEKFPSWPGVRECTKFSPSAIQPPQAPFLIYHHRHIERILRGLTTQDIYKPLSECEREGDSLLQGRSIDDMRSMTPDELLKLKAFHPYCIDGHALTGTFNDGVRAGLTDDYDFLVTYTASVMMLTAVRKNSNTGIMQEVQPLEDETYRFWRDVYCVN